MRRDKIIPNINERKDILRNFKKVLKKNEKDIYQALKNDLNKSKMESYMSELSIVYHEIDFFIKNLDRIAEKKL